MEEKLSGSSHTNGVSLELHSKEVSEVMGNIPSWLSGWGSFIILFLFTVSMLLVFTIRCSQVIDVKSITGIEPVAGSTKSFLVSVPKLGSDKFKAGQQIKISFPGTDTSAKRISIPGVSIVEKKIYGNLCFLQLSATKWPPLLNKTITNCQIISDISAFEKIFGFL